MESAVRRVINLRLKGPGIFWHEEHAEQMLLLRAYYKSNPLSAQVTFIFRELFVRCNSAAIVVGGEV
jgi:hypothetical protein